MKSFRIIRLIGSHGLGIRMSGIIISLIFCLPVFEANAQDSNNVVAPDLLKNLEWINIGPKRGGRSIAVCGSSQRPNEYYFGATGGGLWKTNDGGNSWNPVTDGKIASSSVGAVAVAESNPDIVYLGMGETQLRQNVLQGDGVYKSLDGGETWKNIGLQETQVISRIRIHPDNPDKVYVAALGHPFGPNPERGVFKTDDGGLSWKKVLFKNDKTGAVDLILDPNNPDIIYATLWQVYRKPWILWSGGQGSGLYKSTDGGEIWTEITHNSGLPSKVWGKSTVTVSGADSDRVYVNIEAEDGGLYRSDDGAKTFKLINNHRDLWQRAFYFLRVQADPVDRDLVYILSFKLIKSEDGGLSFSYLPQTHSDHQDLWIDPYDPERMINGNDGGGVVSVNGGQTWTQQNSGLSGNLHHFGVCFTNENDGFVIGFIIVGMDFQNYILKTTNGGQTWDANFNFQNNDFSSLYFINHDVVLIGGLDGFLIKK